MMSQGWVYWGPAWCQKGVKWSFAKTNTCKGNNLEVLTEQFLKQRCSTDFSEMNFGFWVRCAPDQNISQGNICSITALLLGDFQQKNDGEIEVAKDILVPSIRWDSSCFAKTLPNQPCSFTAPMGTKCLILQEISNLELAWLSCCSKKKVGDELVAHGRTSPPRLPAPPLRAAWWSSCHSHLLSSISFVPSQK